MENTDNDLKPDLDSERAYHMLPKSYKEDFIDGVYQIHTSRPVNELSNEFCRYYYASHIETGKEYFAIVFEKSFNVPIKELAILRNMRCATLNNLYTYSLVKLSISKKFLVCAIVDAYNPEKTLEQYIDTNGVLSEREIQEQLVPAISSVLKLCESQKITCGNICPANILITTEGGFKLREFSTSWPNFFQAKEFLPPEIADAIPSGRKTFTTSADIYALGITIFYAFTKSIPDFSKYEPLLLNATRIECGSYDLVVGRRRLPQNLKLFLAWVLQDIPEQRWSADNILEWQNSSKKLKMPKAASSNNAATILFCSRNYANPAALASAMYAFYDEGVKFCRNESFLKWAQKAKGKTDIIEEFIQSEDQAPTASELYEGFLKILSALDYNGVCIRFKDFCVTVASLPNIIFDAVYRGDSKTLTILNWIFSNNYLGEIIAKNPNSALPPEYLNTLSSITSTMSKKNKDVSIESVIYNIDIYTACLSPIVGNDYILSLADLLVSLDKVSAQTPGKLQVDKHITYFIKSRVIESKASEINSMLSNINSIEIKHISLLAKAQEYAAEIKIPHLCSLVAQKLIEWVNDNIHNTKLKHVITSELAELAGGGVLSQMLYVTSNPKLFQNDVKGYNAAYKQVTALSRKVKSLSDVNESYPLGIVLGQKVTVLLSYVLCALVATILIL